MGVFVGVLVGLERVVEYVVGGEYVDVGGAIGVIDDGGV